MRVEVGAGEEKSGDDQGFFLTNATLSLELTHMEEEQGREEGIRLHSSFILASQPSVYSAASSFIPAALEAGRAGLPFPFCRRGELRPTPDCSR